MSEQTREYYQALAKHLARQLAYRVYSICERKGWAEHAGDCSALVISWGASQEQAREFKEQYQQGRLL